MRGGRRTRGVNTLVKVRGVELLERRVMLAVTAAEYAQIASSYPEFSLPANMSQINIIEITADQLSAANLKAALSAAANSAMSDLVVARTTDSQNTITYNSAADEMVVSTPSPYPINIVGFGSRPLTLDAVGHCTVVAAECDAHLGGMIITNGAPAPFPSTYGRTGDGVDQQAGTTILVNVTISNCAGAGASLSITTSLLKKVTITGCRGGVSVSSGAPVLDGLIITGNRGGGVGQDPPYGDLVNTLTIRNSLICGNDGGGVSAGGFVALTNVAISQNLGQGLVLTGAAAAVLNDVTISANWDTGLYMQPSQGTTQPTPNVALQNTIIARNFGAGEPDISGPGTLSGRSNLIGDGSGQIALINGVNGNQVGTAANPIDPKLAEGTTWGIGLAPLTGSPAIDAGDNSLIPGVSADVYQAPRIQNGRVNIGAVETVLPPVPGVTYVVTSLADNTTVDGQVTLREALMAANLNQAVGDAPAGSYSSPDTIVFAPGLAGTIWTDGQPYDICGNLTLIGPGSGKITLNGGGSGGVINIHGTYTVNISGLTVTGASTSAIGGWAVNVTLDHMVVTGNTASGVSLQIYGLGITNSALLSNSGSGVVVSGFNAMTSLVNVAISGNTAAGVSVQAQSALSLANVTISQNGFGLSCGTAMLNNTIVAHNGGGAGGDVSYNTSLSGSNNLIGDGTRQTGLVNGVNGNLVGNSTNPIDPHLAEGLVFGIALSPLPGSPAIDAGDNSLIPAGITTDVYGAPRIQGARVNMGAVETVQSLMPAVTYVVTSLADNTATDGVLTLREALAAANSNQPVGDAPAGSYSSPDVIEFAPGLTGTILTDGQAYQILGSLNLIGPGANLLTLDARSTSGVIQINGTYGVSISGITVTGGNAISGGGVYSGTGATLALSGLVISGNTASGYGGGLYLSGGSATLTNVTISGNTSSGSGGGVYLSSPSVTLTNVTISNNRGSSGGGLYAYASTLTATNLLVTGNSALTSNYGGDGGGIYLASYATAVLTNATISGNTANGILGLSGYGNGGGVYVTSGTLTATNVLFSGNTAKASGGGAYLNYAATTMTNVTIGKNTATTSGGALCVVGGSLTLRNTIVAKNTCGTGPDLYVTGSPTVTAANNLIGNGAGQTSVINGSNGNLVGTATSPIDPKFVNIAGTDWTKWNLRLQASSPAVDKGSNALVPTGITTDLLGVARIQGAAVDMGAYEFDLTIPTVSSFVVNDGSAQRSMVYELVVTFSEPVTLAGSPMGLLTRSGATVPGVAVTALNPSGDRETWVLTFSGGGIVNGSLPDGTYKLVISATGVSDLAGNPMASDYRATFYRLFGDSDGDRVVSQSDLMAMRNVLGQPASAASWSDYDGNGIIDAADLRQLRARLRRTVL